MHPGLIVFGACACAAALGGNKKSELMAISAELDTASQKHAGQARRIRNLADSMGYTPPPWGGQSVAPRGVTSYFKTAMPSEKLRRGLQDDTLRRSKGRGDGATRLMAVTVTAENADDAGMKALYKFQNYATKRINTVAKRRAMRGDSLGAADAERALARLHGEFRKGHIVAYPILISNKGRSNAYKVHVVRRPDSAPLLLRLNNDYKFDYEQPWYRGRSTFGAPLTSAVRNSLPARAFGLPKQRKYPMYTRSPMSPRGELTYSRTHAINAKGRARQQLNAGNLSEGQYERIVGKANRLLARHG